MKACVVKAHRAGLFSNLNKVITCLRMYDHVQVDWSNSIYGNCWKDLFAYNDTEVGKQYDLTGRGEYYPLENYDTITDYPFYDLTAACAGVLYQNEGWGWRERFHELWLKLQVKEELQQAVTSYIGEDGSRFVGALVRSDGHKGEQMFGRTQSLEEYAQAIRDSGKRELFLVAADKETVKWFSNRFETACYFNTKRVEHRSVPDRHLTEQQTVEDAKQAMIEVLTLARCGVLAHPISNMATASLYINPKQKSIYLK